MGTLLSKILARLGITPELVEQVTGKPCGCKARGAALDDWSQRVGLAAFRWRRWLVDGLVSLAPPRDIVGYMVRECRRSLSRRAAGEPCECRGNRTG